ncbi:MAG: LysE family transporter, partial [Hyphomicrobiales bacterium]|nr:LysE family transporter [Hyphomicrobiales bacterium]
MSLELYLTFVAATAILILIPGPNVALIVANSVAHGSRYGLLTVAGTSSAVVIQLLLTIAGMTTFLSVMANWFEWLR